MSYAIQNMKGKHLGFILMAGHQESGDCIFRSLAAKSEEFCSAVSELLFNLQNGGEFRYSSNGVQISISHNELDSEFVINQDVLSIGEHNFKVVELESS